MMKAAFQRLYGAEPFDPNDRQQQLAESARKLLLATAIDTTKLVQGGQDMPYLLGGLLVGIVQVLQATANPQDDETDAAIRASIMQIAPWAVDMARSCEGKEPLANV
jgi:hypothetical protein